MTQSFQPGDKVIWWKGVGGGFANPVEATVIAVTPKRVTITARDPDERGAGIVTRHVSPTSLRPREVRPTTRRHAKVPSRQGSRQQPTASPASFESRYPHIADWVRDGWIEIGHDDCGRPFLRAMSIGGIVWEGDDSYATLDDALQAMDDGIAAWLRENE